jgi:tetratricopeptide (TPR) repeat protein
VGALNEHLRERLAGNALYRAGRLEEAEAKYVRARAVLEVIEAISEEDAAEVRLNRVCVLGNMAALHFARAEYGAAAARCSEALALDPDNVKLLLRRAKALAQRAEWGLASEDLRRVKELEPWSEEAEEQAAALRRMQLKERGNMAAFAASALRG